MECADKVEKYNWQYEYHRIRDSRFFWCMLCVLAVLLVLLTVEVAQADSGFEGAKIPITVLSVLTAITLFSYCVTAHYNGMKKVYHYELANGVISYAVPSHPITKKQTGNSVYLKQYFKKMSYGVGEKGKYRLSGITEIKPSKSAGRITICGTEGKFTVRAGKDDFDTVLAHIRDVR